MKRIRFSLLSVALLLVLAFSAVNAFGEAQIVLTRHVPNAGAQPIGRLPPGQIMNLDVVLPVRDQAGLKTLVKQIIDPASPSYRHFLSVQEFTARFGPSQEDYDALVRFVRESGFSIVGGTRDSMDVQIRGPVSAVETAFNITMRTYQHPTENRSYYAPDREPTVNLPLPLWHISGLSNYSIPHPVLSNKSDYAKAHGIAPEALVPLATTGSGPSGSFLGSDMRAAYYGQTAYTGSGQNLGLFEYKGTDLADLATYFNNVGQTNNVPITLLSTDGTPTTCTAAAGCDDLEQTIDMTQAIGMAPGLSSLVMYIGSTDTAILGAMTTHSPLPMTIGCSWNWLPADPTTLDPYFERMAAQGQTFFQASGDHSTWSSTNNDWPADDAYVVSVGGTDLTTANAGGAWQSEIAWVASGGGISPNNIPIPWWQQLPGVINSSNRGSTVLRNGPDVSANANWSFYVCANQTACTAGHWGGTSFAAPMWAGYIALVNQEAGTPAGFINPTIYPQNVGPSYDADFHDITSGTSGSFSAVIGYDLVTGWGTPNAGLINALVPSDLAISKTAPFSVVAGGLLTYSLNVTNNGPSNATGVVITDTLPGATAFLTSSIPCTAGGTCTIGNLANGASASFTITVRVSASLLSNLGASATNITNTATVKADQFDPNLSNNTATASTLVTESADMSLTKVCKPDTPAQAGTSAFCDIQVANLGVSDAQNVVVTDAIVSTASFTVTSVTGAAASCTTSIGSPTSATATCNLLTVAAGGGTTIHVAFTSNDPGDINDTARVTSTTPDPVGGNNSATGRVSFFASADLAISKRAAPNPVVAGTNVRYTIAVSNAGPSSASNVVVKDTLPAEVRVLTVTPSVGSCTAGIPGNPLQPLTCTIGSMVPAGFATIAVEVRVDSNVPAWRVINNNATVSSAASDPNNGNNSATAAVTVFTRCFCCNCRQLGRDDDDEKLNREDEER